MGGKAHRNIRVSGFVQGVFFRRAAKQKAEELGLSGFARNLRDGSVYLEAEGKSAALDEFVRWCAEGPPGAKVKEVRTEEGQLRNYSEFLVF